MSPLKTLVRSTGVLAAAGCLGFTLMSAPAQAASGACEQNHVCLWSGKNFTGTSGKIAAQPGKCYNSRSVPAQSMNNNTRYFLRTFPKANCKGHGWTMNWGTKSNDLPQGVMSFMPVK
ncbi:peptidase inhibitor family I36 protein [Streptomyces rimosus]